MEKEQIRQAWARADALRDRAEREYEAGRRDAAAYLRGQAEDAEREARALGPRPRPKK